MNPEIKGLSIIMAHVSPQMTGPLKGVTMAVIRGGGAEQSGVQASLMQRQVTACPKGALVLGVTGGAQSAALPKLGSLF